MDRSQASFKPKNPANQGSHSTMEQSSQNYGGGPQRQGEMQQQSSPLQSFKAKQGPSGQYGGNSVNPTPQRVPFLQQEQRASGGGGGGGGGQGQFNYGGQQRSPMRRMQRPAVDLNPTGPSAEVSKLIIPPPTRTQIEPGCICKRKVESIWCGNCGFFYEDVKHIHRVRKVCPVHPKVIFPTDFSKCPDCPNTLEEGNIIPGEY